MGDMSLLNYNMKIYTQYVQSTVQYHYADFVHH